MRELEIIDMRKQEEEEEEIRNDGPSSFSVEKSDKNLRLNRVIPRKSSNDARITDISCLLQPKKKMDVLREIHDSSRETMQEKDEENKKQTPKERIWVLRH